MVTVEDLRNALIDYKALLEGKKKITFEELLSWCEVTDARTELLFLQQDLDTITTEICLDDRCEVWGVVAQVLEHLSKVQSILRTKVATPPKLRLISFGKE